VHGISACNDLPACQVSVLGLKICKDLCACQSLLPMCVQQQEQCNTAGVLFTIALYFPHFPAERNFDSEHPSIHRVIDLGRRPKQCNPFIISHIKLLDG